MVECLYNLMPSAPTNIIHIVREAQGGMRKHVLTVIAGMDTTRFLCSLVASRRFLAAVRDMLAGDMDTMQAGIGDSVGPRGLASLPGIIRFVRRKGQPRIIHAHGYTAAMVGAVVSRFSDTPFVFTAHNLLSKKALPVTRMAAKMASQFAAGVIAVSESVKSSLEDAGVNAAKIRVIPNGIEPPSLPGPFDRETKLAELGLPTSARVVLCVARLTPVKGVRYLIEAMPALRQNVPEARLVIAGDGPERQELVDLDSRLNAESESVFLGHRNDIAELLAAADVVAIPSLEEGQGLVLLEAMAAGRPVVATRVGGLAETVRDGETGLLAEPANSGDLAAKLSLVMSSADLAASLSNTAARFVAEQMSAETMISRLEEVYTQCVTEH